jgi:hypothetical protein
MKPMRAVRGMSQPVWIVILLLACGALSAQNQEHRTQNIWFTVPGQMVLAGKAFTTFLSRMATASASSKSRRRPFKEDVAATKRRCSIRWAVHSCRSQHGGAVITEAGTDPSVAGLVYVAAHMPDAPPSLACNLATSQH